MARVLWMWGVFYSCLQRHEIVFLVLMVHLIKALQLGHFKALIELLGCSRPLTFDCSPHQRQTNHSKSSPALLLQHSAGMWCRVDKSFTTISSGLLGCYLILVGYTMLQTVAISICRHWESCLSDIHELKKKKEKEKKRGRRTREAGSWMLAGNCSLAPGRCLTCVVVCSYLCWSGPSARSFPSLCWRQGLFVP